MPAIETQSYKVTDSFFGAPYVDADEMRAKPSPYRFIHGGFEGTDTRFSFCFPEAAIYHSRLFQPLEGANAGHENVNTGPLGLVTGGLEMAFRLGGYTVESNMGHVGDVKDPKAGDDPTIYGFRAAAECARFSKHVAAQIYGAAPKFAYVFGGSGGARRSPLCLAYAPGVWDAALPYMGDAMDSDHGDMRRIRQGGGHFACMFNVQRVLGAKIYDVVDAMWPGGSGDPFVGLTAHQREELANLYRLGYPRGDEYMIAQPMGQIWLWSSLAKRMTTEDAYFKRFWTEPGHMGHDQPQHVTGDLIERTVKVKRALTAQDLIQDPAFAGPEFAALRGLASIFAGMQQGMALPMAIELPEDPGGYGLGAGVTVVSGKAAGRQLYCINGVKTVWLCDGEGEDSNKRFRGLEPGDEVRLDNRDFLAYCYYYRHHLRPTAEYEAFKVDGHPIYPTYEEPLASPFMGVAHTGKFEGKMMWVHHTHDASLWPTQGVGMRNNILRECGPEILAERFRLRWTENAEHVPPSMAPPSPKRAVNTWLINYQPVIEQCLKDLTAWVEDDVAPAGTNFELRDGQIHLPADAAARGGIQPVVAVTVKGATRAEAKAGQPVVIDLAAETPPGAGTFIAARWDFDGTGKFAKAETLDGKASKLALTTTHVFDKPGTFFVTAMVESHRDGDVKATSRRIPNVAAVRVVVS